MPNFRTCPFSRGFCLLLSLGLLFGAAPWLQAQTTRRPAAQRPKPTVSAASAAQAQLKGIWEPINYPDDLTLLDVFFASDQAGWIAGGLGWDNGGFILQTKDGGSHWTFQLGDPKSSDPSIHDLRFVDGIHGWAVQGAKLVRTSDGGANWEDAGSLNNLGPLHDYVFTSPRHGILMTGFATEPTKIFVSNDAGQTWKQAFVCGTRFEQSGLMRNVGCQLQSVHFATPSVGYAVGGAGNNISGPWAFVTARTEDGGATWTVVSTIANAHFGDRVFFRDANNGASRNGDKFYKTMDGGLTWSGATGDGAWEGLRISFSDPQVGWSGGARKIGFTTDGGAHWNSRDLHFPEDVLAFCFPSRQRGYAVGPHGMIYRYLVVSAGYTATNAIDAPLVPGYDSPLDGEVATVKSAVNDLAIQMQKSLGITAPVIAMGTGAAALQIGNIPQSTSVSPGQSIAQGGFQTSTQAAPGQTATQGGFQQSAADSGPPAQGGQQGGFPQPPGVSGGGIVASCCGSALQNLQMATSTFATDLPQFSSKFRNLNLIVAGLQFVNDMLQRTNTLKLTINNLRQAPDKQSAAAALATLSNQVNGIPPDVNSGFVQDTSSASPQTPGGAASFTNLGQPGNLAAQSATPSNAQQQSARQATNSVDQLEKAKDKLNKLTKKIPW